MSRVIAFGSSPIRGNPGFPEIIANHLGREYLDKSKQVSSNSKISRIIVSTEYSPDDFALVAWTSTIRHEFRTEHGWMASNMATYNKGTGSFEDHWYAGPGNWEYTGVSTALKEIILAQTFFKEKQLSYLFTFDNNDVIDSLLISDPDPYIASLVSMINWKQILLFENNGFINWCRKKNYSFDQGHMSDESHQIAADYIIENFKLPAASNATTV